MTEKRSRVVIITGAGQGIGRSYAKAFAEDGDRVVVADINAEATEHVRAEVEAAGGQAIAVTVDVTDPESTAAMVEAAISEWGTVDVLVNNAAIFSTLKMKPFDEIDVDVFDRVMAVNVRSVWLGLAALMAAMRERGGSIVITSSTAGLRGSAHLAAYAASKHAVIGLMRSAALEGAAHGIRVNTVNPGPTQTRMMGAIDDAVAVAAGKAASSNARFGRIPLGRYGTVEEIVALMLYLLSDESSFSTGATFLADGGMLSGASA